MPSLNPTWHPVTMSLTYQHAQLNTKTSNNEPIVLALCTTVFHRQLEFAVGPSVQGPGPSRTASGAYVASAYSTTCFAEGSPCAGRNTIMSDASQLTVISTLADTTAWGV